MTGSLQCFQPWYLRQLNRFHILPYWKSLSSYGEVEQIVSLSLNPELKSLHPAQLQLWLWRPPTSELSASQKSLRFPRNYPWVTQLNNLSHVIDVLEKCSDMMKKVETPHFQRKKEHDDKIIPRTGNNPSGLKVPLATVRSSQAGPPQPAELRTAVLRILAFSNKNTYCEHDHYIPLPMQFHH